MVIQNNRPISPQIMVNNPNSSISSSSSTNTQTLASTKIFSENFWGDKINGFDVLCQNLKYSLTSVKDLEQFVRESFNCEDTYGRSLNKLVSQINKYSINGTFNPVWSILKELNEKYSTTHAQFAHQLQDLIKDIQKYNEDLSKKIKRIRENEQQTQIVVQNFQEIQQNLNKAKEQYHNLCTEFDKQRKQLDSQQLTQYQQLSQQQVSTSNLLGLLSNQNQNQSNLPSNSNQLNTNFSSLTNTITANKVTQLLKTEKKMKLSLEDYKLTIEKYNSIRVDFERKLADSCNQFQLAEETHLKQMKIFVETYSRLTLNCNQSKQQIYNEFNSKLNESYTIDYLIQLFIENKKTGVDRPEPAVFVESSVMTQPQPQPAQQNNITLNENEFNLVLNSTSSNQTNVTLPSISPLPFQAQSTDLLDSRPNDFSLFQNNQTQPTTQQRSTPTFFTSSSLYSQLTNSSSNTTLNSLNQVNQNNLTRSSPINSSPSNNEQNNMKRNDSKGLNIFNVDFLGRNKNKDKKNNDAKSKFSKNKKTKQQQQQPNQQYENLNSTNVSVGNNTSNNKDTISINSDQNETNQNETLNSNLTVQQNGSVTARSISSITGSLSLDLLDHYKISNGSDIDSEGYSLRPDSSMDLRRKVNDNLKNDDMNNYYGSSSTSSGSESDSDSGEGGPVKVMLKINPKSEQTNNDKNSNDVLREISKNLQLKPPGLQNSNQKQLQKKRTYYYNYGTSNPDQSQSPWAPTNEVTNNINNNNMTRSISTGSVNSNSIINNANLFSDLKLNDSSSNQKTENSLLDLNFNTPSPKLNNSSSVPNTLSLNKPNENNSLYNIDEDKEVESSFQYGNLQQKKNLQNSVISSSSPANMQGRFTPACFPGRTTPDFRHTTSLFEQQGTRASIVSPLTIAGSEIIPIAIAFNETIHAYFKIGDSSKFKIKCFGCMKISFPFAILKLLAIELPQLEFRLSNLQIANQDLKLNNQLLEKMSNDNLIETDDFKFKFINTNLINELKQQHQQNKLAAFFNFELLKYEFKFNSQAPLVLNASWACNPEEQTIELNLEYLFIFRKNLSQTNFMVLIPINLVQNGKNYKLSLTQSEPNFLTQENDNKLQVLWQIGSLSANGRIYAKFSISSVSQDESKYQNLEQLFQPVYAKFHIDNETLSKVKFDILSQNYKLSLLKEKIETGKYFCNYDPQQQQMNQSQLITNNSFVKKPQITAQISTQIGSTVDLLNS